MEVLGIDISKADFHACLIDGQKRKGNSFPNTPTGYKQLLAWLRNRKCNSPHACMEATGSYWYGVALALDKAGLKVSVVPPSRTALFARSQLRRTKTDSVDAEMIAEFCLTQSPTIWEPPAAGVLELRGFLSYRNQLVVQRTALKQLAAQVTMNAELQRLHREQIDALKLMIDNLEEQMRALVGRHSSIKRDVEIVQSIPGFGFLSAVSVAVRLPVDRIRNAKAAGAYVGLSPQRKDSGTSVHGKPRICKIGNSDLRRELYMPALTAMRFNPSLSIFAGRLKERGKPNKVVLAAIMRKLVVLAYTLLKSGMPYDRALAA